MRRLLVVCVVAVLAACGGTGAPSRTTEPSRAPTARPTRTPLTPDVTATITADSCTVAGPEVLAAGTDPLVVDVRNDSPHGADMNLLYATPDAPDDLLDHIAEVVAEANVAIQEGREPTWFSYAQMAHRDDVVLDPGESAQLRAPADPGTWFLLCFLGYSNGEGLPVFASNAFVTE